MVIAIALRGFNDLRRSMTSTFLFRNEFEQKYRYGHRSLPFCGYKARETYDR